MLVRLNQLFIARSLARRSWHRRLTAAAPGSPLTQPARAASAPFPGAFVPAV